MRKRIIFIIAVCVVLISVAMSVYVGGNTENISVLKAHREDFTMEIASEIKGQFAEGGGLKKAYLILTNEWYLAENLSDFSQVVTTDIVYVAEDVENGYSFYQVNGESVPEWNCLAYPPADAIKPLGFYGLSDEIIVDALESVRYEDYIFTYSQRLRTVFVWV